MVEKKLTTTIHDELGWKPLNKEASSCHIKAALCVAFGMVAFLFFSQKKIFDMMKSL